MAEADQSIVKHCSKCRNHGVLSPLKGHKRRCPVIKCCCEKCCLVEARRDISKRQMALRRLQIEEEIFGVTETNNNMSINTTQNIEPIANSRQMPMLISNKRPEPPAAGPHYYNPELNHQQNGHIVCRNWCNPYHQRFYTQPHSNDPSNMMPYNNDQYGYVGNYGRQREVNQIIPRCQIGSIGNSQTSEADDGVLVVDLNACTEMKPEMLWPSTEAS